MKRISLALIISVLLPLLAVAQQSGKPAVYAGWQHSGVLTVLTTPEGANLPAGTHVEEFPLLVRLNRDFFDFNQAKPTGDDLRFSTATGVPLHFQIEQWDAANGTAAIWVRMPRIEGNSRQSLLVYWGNANAASESNGQAVFNESNGYLSVWHMADSVRDEVGTLQSTDKGTTDCVGIIGKARHFSGQQGILGGTQIATYPQGSSPHTSEAWFRAEKSNGRILAWGNEAAQGKVVMHLQSPPHVKMDCYFSDANISGVSSIAMEQWVHVVHTYEKGDSRLYVDGVLDAEVKAGAAPLSLKTPARLWIGGWYDRYDFVGAIDEVRVSKVVRPPDWIRLQFENQKPLQTLVGPVMQPGTAFSISPAQVTVGEGQHTTFTAQAGGAQKLYWTLIRDGVETLVATDRLTLSFEAGRVTGDASATLRLKAIHANEIKSRDIPIRIQEAIPDPGFSLEAPAAWDGRTPVEIVPHLTHREALQVAGAEPLKTQWSVSGIAASTTSGPGKLVLVRAHNSGLLTVSATLSNGGKPVTHTAVIAVKEPTLDPWIARVPEKDEKPEDGQFYPRDDRNEGTLFYNGILGEAAEFVFLKVYAGDKLLKTESSKPGADRSYAFTVKLIPGLVTYRVEFGTRNGTRDTVLHKAGNLVCGDAYLIDGQSNAEATAFGKEDYLFSSDWIRSYGSPEGSPDAARLKLWGNAVARGKGGRLQIGYWGMELARRLVESRKMPICILNGAVGGTRIDQHQRNVSAPEDVATIYGRLLGRVRAARLTHGIRGVLWHQGENDQGADGPTGGFGWESYRQYFIEMAGAWKQDYPNIQQYYLFQIWPKSCAMGIDGSDNRLREVQRQLPRAFAHMSIMSTLGIEPGGGCHYPPEGYAEIARLICPLVEHSNYGQAFPLPITPPNLVRAGFLGGRNDELVLEFDQPVKWDDALAGQFYLDGEKGKVASGSVKAKVLTLKLATPCSAKTLTYLDGSAWSQKTLLRGENGIAALTFCEVPLETGKAVR